MNDLDTALRDALAARATTVTHDPRAYDAIVRRRARRRLARWTRPLAAAAAAVAVLGGVVAVTRAPAPDGAPAGARPARMVVLRPGGNGARPDALVVSSGDLGGPPLLSVTDAVRGAVHAVAAVGDGATFYVAAGESCDTALLRVDVARGLTEVARADGFPVALAVSADGRRLAYSYTRADPARGCQPPSGAAAVVRVKDLRTGEERTWTARRAPQDIALSPDGTRLAFAAQQPFGVVAMDVARPEGPLPAPARDLEAAFMRGDRGACVPTAPAYLPDGELVVLAHCSPTTAPGSSTVRVRAFDPAAATFGRELFRLPAATQPLWLSVDRTGGHVLAGVSERGARRRVYHWDGRGEPERLDGPEVERVAW